MVGSRKEGEQVLIFDYYLLFHVARRDHSSQERSGSGHLRWDRERAWASHPGKADQPVDRDRSRDNRVEWEQSLDGSSPDGASWQTGMMGTSTWRIAIYSERASALPCLRRMPRCCIAYPWIPWIPRRGGLIGSFLCRCWSVGAKACFAKWAPLGKPAREQPPLGMHQLDLDHRQPFWLHRQEIKAVLLLSRT